MLKSKYLNNNNKEKVSYKIKNKLKILSLLPSKTDDLY